MNALEKVFLKYLQDFVHGKTSLPGNEDIDTKDLYALSAAHSLEAISADHGSARSMESQAVSSEKPFSPTSSCPPTARTCFRRSLLLFFRRTYPSSV